MANFTAYAQQSPRSRTVYVPFVVDDSVLARLTRRERNDLLAEHAVAALKASPKVSGDWWEWLRCGWFEGDKEA
jgi:hypothetical protein